MSNILFKTLSLAVIGITAPTTAIASSASSNLHNTIQATKLINHNPVNFPNNNPVYKPFQHDSQGADTVTLSNITSTGFDLNYILSAATLSFFWPEVGQFIWPSTALNQLLTSGTAMVPTTRYWQPLKSNNAFSTFINSSLYNSYLGAFHHTLDRQFYYKGNDTAATANMANFIKAMNLGSAFEITAAATVSGQSVTGVGITTKIMQANYPPAAKTNGVDAVFGNMFEPNNPLNVNLSKSTCQGIVSAFPKNPSGFIKWLFRSSGYYASASLNKYINSSASTQGIKDNNQKASPYWTKPNYQLAQTAITQQFNAIIQAAQAPGNIHGITLVFTRNQAGAVNLAIQKQMLAYRPVYNNQNKVELGATERKVYLNVKAQMSLRSACFRYLTATGGYTQRAEQDALNWFFGGYGDWANADVIHPNPLAGYLQKDRYPWAMGFWKFDYVDADQAFASAIVQNRGIILDLDLKTNIITVLNQNLAS